MRTYAAGPCGDKGLLFSPVAPVHAVQNVVGLGLKSTHFGLHLAYFDTGLLGFDLNCQNLSLNPA